PRINSGDAIPCHRSGPARVADCGNDECPDPVLVWDLRHWIVDLRLGWSCALPRRSRRLRECNPSRDSLDNVHVDRPHRPDLVRLRLGNPAARDWIPLDLSLSAHRRPSLSKIPPAAPGHLAFSLARISDHGGRRPDQNARRHMLARSHLSLLSLRNPAHPEPDQPLPAFRADVVPQGGDGLEPFRRIGRALVFIWTADRAP